MIKFTARFVLLLFLFLFCVRSYAQYKDEMFRGNPAHNVKYSGFDGMIFNQQAWQFNAGAAIRSTPIVVGSILYVGSSDGSLYAIDKRSGQLKWKFACGSAITSSPAYSSGIIYVIGQNQELFALNSSTGTKLWKMQLGANVPYDWGFDYYISSPVINGDTLLAASAEGKLYAMKKRDGKNLWTFSANSFLRATPAVSKGSVYIGDVNGTLYAIDSRTGKKKWDFQTEGSSLNNDSFGFDRKAIISSAVVEGNTVAFGCRDGFLYAVDATSGKQIWKFDHQVSWVISSPVVANNQVITGTSDGRFVQAVDIASGGESWRATAFAPVWSSPLVCGNTVYIGGNDGVLYALDLTSGKKLPHPFCINSKIFSSPIVSDSMMYFGTDEGLLYALRPEKISDTAANRYVFWEQTNGFNYFRNSVDVLAKDFLIRKGYVPVDRKQLLSLLTDNRSSGNGKCVVLISSQLPAEILQTDSTNVFRQFLESGGMVTAIGNNPFSYKFNEKGELIGFDFKRCGQILGITYPTNDLRSMGGIFTCKATTDGLKLGVPKSWTGTSPVNKGEVDIVLGVDEKERASAWYKKIGKGSYTQLWIDQLFPQDYNFVDRVMRNLEMMN